MEPNENCTLTKKRKLIEKKELQNKEPVNSKENSHIAFFNSLIPALERLDEDKVIQFQIGVLSVLQNVKKGRPIYYPPCHSIQHCQNCSINAEKQFTNQNFKDNLESQSNNTLSSSTLTSDENDQENSEFWSVKIEPTDHLI